MQKADCQIEGFFIIECCLNCSNESLGDFPPFFHRSVTLSPPPPPPSSKPLRVCPSAFGTNSSLFLAAIPFVAGGLSSPSAKEGTCSMRPLEDEEEEDEESLLDLAVGGGGGI